MWAIFLQTLPFFTILALGYWSGRSGFFTPAATAYLTKFVFYFALSAMLFKFTSGISFGELFDWTYVLAYLCASLLHYLITTVIARMRGHDMAVAAFEAQCAVSGNTGFLGLPMLALLFGAGAVGPVVQIMVVDMVVFGSFVVIAISIAREGRITLHSFQSVGRGLIRNPMIVSIALGLGFAALPVEMPVPGQQFLDLLGAAATPGALFAIGASLATKSAEQPADAIWLAVTKLVLHPLMVALAAFLVFPIAPFEALVMVSAAALPVAGNVYILAQHYEVIPQRVSASILYSTAASIVTLPVVIALAGG